MTKFKKGDPGYATELRCQCKKDKAPEGMRWFTCFAFLPTLIDGTLVWFEFYEKHVSGKKRLLKKRK